MSVTTAFRHIFYRLNNKEEVATVDTEAMDQATHIPYAYRSGYRSNDNNQNLIQITIIVQEQAF